MRSSCGKYVMDVAIYLRLGTIVLTSSKILQIRFFLILDSMFVIKVGTLFLKVVMGNKLDTVIFTFNTYFW
jgi:hypothetical protein